MKYRYLWVGCVVWGCGAKSSHDPRVEGRLSFHAQSSDGSQLSGVVLEAGGKRVSSAPDGTAELRLAGSEGERCEIRVSCPENFESPPEPLQATIRRPSNVSQSFRYDVVCTPLRHTVVLVARISSGSSLPILRLGSEIGRTNEDGVAHALLSVPIGESLRFTVDTDGAPGLRPRNPSFDFPAVDQDEILTINQAFERPRPTQVRRRSPAKKQDSRPTRL
jgi:hypothetical protein